MLLGSIFWGFKPSIDYFLFACKKINNFWNNRTHEETVLQVIGRVLKVLLRAEVGFAFAKRDLVSSLGMVICLDLNPANCISILCFYIPTDSYPFRLQGYYDILGSDTLLKICSLFSCFCCMSSVIYIIKFYSFFFKTLLFWTIYLPAHQASSSKCNSSIDKYLHVSVFSILVQWLVFWRLPEF